MGNIAFKQIPSTLRVPLFFAELDASQANSATQAQRTLIIGQMKSGAGGVANIPVLAQSIGDAQSVGGVGSMLDLMMQAYRASDAFGEVWLAPLTDPGGVAATGTVVIGGTVTAPGVISLYIAGVRVQLAVSASQATTAIATALAAAINATPNMPVTASAGSSTVTLTAVNVGTVGNDIDVRMNYGGTAAGESTPTGMTATITAMASGTLVPALTTMLTNCASQPFDFIVCPYTDTTSLTALQAFLNDTTGRWAWSQQIYGHVFAALRGTTGTLTTAGAAQNSQHQSILGFNDSPTPNWQVAADFAGACASSLRNDPGVPLQTVALGWMKPPPVQSRFSLAQQNALLYTGISTFTVGVDGTVALQNVITSYLTNSFGQPDNSYLEVETLFTLMFVLRFMSGRISTKFARKKLASNLTRTTNPNVVTPNIIKADIIAAYRQLESDFVLVQNSAAFAQMVAVEQDATNPNRVNILWPGTLIDQLRIVALLAQFRLQ